MATVTGSTLVRDLIDISSISTTGNVTVGGYLAGPSTFTIDPAGVGDNTGTVVIAGNLQVDGTTTTINSTTVTVDDLNLTLASGAANAAAANGAGLTVDGANATITYDSSNDEWDFNKNINITGNLILSGTVDGRDVATDGSKLDGIESGATADQTASEILTLIKTVDGSGSGLDADLLDGLNSASFSRQYILPNTGGSTGWVELGTASIGNSGNHLELRIVTGSGYNASDQQDNTVIVHFKTSNNSSNTNGFYANARAYKFGPNSTPTVIRVVQNSNSSYTFHANFSSFTGSGSFYTISGLGFNWSHSGTNNGATAPTGTFEDIEQYEIWHAGNDGTGSGLDADLLDGQQGSYYLDYQNLTNTPGAAARIEEFPTVTNGSASVTMANSYTLNRLDVYLNGARMKSGTDYSVSGTTLTFTENLQTGDIVAIYAYDLDVNNLITGNWNDLNDVSVTGASANDIIRYDGGSWVVAPASIDSSGNLTTNGDLIVSGGQVGVSTVSTRHKYSVYGSSSTYAIGMQSGITFGGLADWGMTFQFNNEDDRGFWWGDESHSTAQGAMALTTNGKLTVAHSARIGYGESDTTIPGATHRVDVNGSVNATTYHGDGSNLTGISAGATGGSTDQVFYENDQTVTTNYTITSNKNAMTAGDITINNGVTVTIPAGSTWTIV